MSSIPERKFFPWELTQVGNTAVTVGKYFETDKGPCLLDLLFSWSRDSLVVFHKANGEELEYCRVIYLGWSWESKLYIGVQQNFSGKERVGCGRMYFEGIYNTKTRRGYFHCISCKLKSIVR
ncbi:MAG: hypothetical protein V1838_00140 [Patescibacteria group bacterium]